MQAKVFWVAGPWRGRLGILPRPRGGDWLDDEVAAWRAAGIDMVVSLLEPEEEAQLALGGEAAAASRSGIEFRRFSIPDCGVPASRESVAELVDDIVGTLDHGKNVTVHCRQGIGRSGMIVAGVLVAAGKDLRGALGTIKESRGLDVPETEEQRRWIRDFSSWLAARHSPPMRLTTTMPPSPLLELSTADMRAMADAVVERCIDHIATLDRQPSSGDVDAAALCRAMREPAPEHGTALEPLLDQLFRDWVPRSFTAPGPGYVAFIPGGGLYPAALADFIADTTNRYTGVWQAAPALVQLEANALDWLRDWMEFPATTRGLFTAGGSMATWNAILCARERHLGADIRRGVLYASDQAHHSVLKAAKLAGVMPDRVRAVESDAAFKLRIDALEAAIASDRRAGLTPFAVVSSAGTTNTGAIDPLEGVADLCARESLWHHVDGAYGAFFYLCGELREALRGLSRADSLTLDPHKGMFLPYGTGALLVRDGSALRAAHEATAAYLPAMPHPEDFYDPSQHGPELSRGFPGLRVWLCVKLFGSAAFRDALAEKRALALDAARRVAALPGIVMDAPPELSLFAFHLTWPGATQADEDAATQALMAETTRRGRVMVTGATAHGRYLGRVCVLSFRTHHPHINALVEDLDAAIRGIVPR